MVRDHALPCGVEYILRVIGGAEPGGGSGKPFGGVGELLVLLVEALAQSARSITAYAVVGGNQLIVPNRQLFLIGSGKFIFHNAEHAVRACQLDLHGFLRILLLFGNHGLDRFFLRRAAAVTHAVQQVGHGQVVFAHIFFELVRRVFVLADFV